PGGAEPAGHVALEVLERASRPVVVVPPEAVAGPDRPVRRVLLPLEGDVSSARPLAEDLGDLVSDDVELVVLHVLTATSPPPILDHAEWDLPLWTGDFLERFCPMATRIDLRTGPVGPRVLDVCAEVDADLVVLSWSQDASEGH